MKIKCVVHNPRGKGGQAVPGVGVLGGEQTVEATLSQKDFDSFVVASSLQLAKAGSKEYDELLQKGVAEQERGKTNAAARKTRAEELVASRAAAAKLAEVEAKAKAKTAGGKK